MKTITHQQAQEWIRAGKETPELEQDVLDQHLSTCPDCQAYAALVDDLNQTIPGLYLSPALPEQDLRQKARGDHSNVRRYIMMAQISRAARSIVYIGAALAFLLILVIMSPRLLPNQPGTVADPTAVPSVSVDPAPTLEATEIDPASKGSFLYLVSEGETLFGIADKFNLKPETVLWSNSDLLLDNPGLIQPGMILRIPSVDGLYYRWETGDTVEAVAAKFGAEPQAIRDWPENQKGTRESGDLEIQAGTLLFVPGGKRPLQPVIPPTTEETKTKRIISPDGRYAAVYQHGPGLLRIEDVQSGQTQISGFSGVVNPGNWSPDSRYLLYWENTVDSASIQADGLPLWTLDVGTSEAKLISTTPVNSSYQSWSPDGRKLIFTNGGYRSAQVDKWLSIYNTSTGEVRDLIPKEVLVPGAVDWSPDGKWIAVAAVEGSKTGPEYADYMGWDNPAIAARRMYLVDPMTGDFQRLTQSEAYEDAPRWSEDGKQLFFVQAEGTRARVIAATVETGVINALEDCEMPLLPDAGYYGQVDWSALYAACDLSKAKTKAGTPSVNASSLKDASPQTLAHVLFEEYLKNFLDEPTDPQAKLISYQIEKVEIPEKWQPCAELHKAEFIAAITFSVKPERWPPPRWATDGTLTDDHWINGKRASIAVFRSGQDYKMELLGIPICPGY